MISPFAPVTALLLSAAIFLVGNGLQTTLLPLRANIEGFSPFEIGLMGTAYYIGFGIGGYFGGRIVLRAGHIRTFSAMASLASAAALLHVLFLSPELWWIFRIISGVCFAVLYVVIESWLNEVAENDNRGRVLSVYNVINLTMITIGQMMLTLYDPAAFPLFALSSVLVSVSVIPIAMTRAAAPAPVKRVTLRLPTLYKTSPVACVGAMIVGLSTGAFWTLGPVYTQIRGFDVAGTAIFMSVAVLSGAASQWPLGRLSDLFDRRYTIFGACAIGATGSIALAAMGEPGYLQTVALIAIFGTTAFPLYPLCIAHMNDFARRDEFVGTAGAMLLLYSIGAALGPIPAAKLMEAIGPSGLFSFSALGFASLAAFTLYRIQRRSARPSDSLEPFVGIPRTSPTLYALDPRGDNLDRDIDDV